MDCGSLLQGRIDKKFCDDYCRSNYNNVVRAESNNMIRRINLILKRNRDILEKFNPHGRTRINSVKLEAAGFDPGYHTHTSHTEQGMLHTFCYEQGYQQLEAGEFLLIRETSE